jgi:hypothetical protein
MTKGQLHDGSEFRVTPSTKKLNQQLAFIWLALDFDDGLKTKIQGYIDNNTKVKITTSESENFYGYFISLSRVWLSGVEDQEDIQAIFDRSLS